MRIGTITSGAKYRMDEKSKTLLIFGILTVFQIEKFLKIDELLKFKNFGYFFIFEFGKFQKFPI